MPRPLALLHAKSFLRGPWHYLRSHLHLRRNLGVERWADMNSLDPKWDARTAIAARMIPPHSRVLEFGAGREVLRSMLPEGCTYQPSDIVARSPHMWACDLNEDFPKIAEPWDVMLFSGVMEYIEDVPRLLRLARQHSSLTILAYMATDQLECISTRMRSGWINHFDRATFERILREAGFTIREHEVWNGQDIYCLA